MKRDKDYSVEDCEKMPLETKRKKWDAVMMMRAVKAVRNREMGYKKAAKYFEVPKGTLERYVKNSEKTVESLVNVRMGRKPTLPQHLEDLLVKYCVEMDSRFYGLRRRDIKKMAFQLAIKNGLNHPFSYRQQCAADKWLKGFLRRHTQLSLKKPQGTSFARVKGFSPQNVKRFFEIYEPELLKINSQPHSSSENVARINQTTNKLLVTPEEINPLPTLAKNDPSKPTRARKADIITSTPYKNKLGESTNKKAPASLKKTLFPTRNKGVGKGAPTGKRKMDENTPLVKIRRKNKPNYSDDDLSSIEDDERLSLHDSSDDSIGDNDAECLFCGSLFSEDKRGEQWRQCRRCLRWAHEDCGADEVFVCKQCEKFESKNKK
ncbi:tc5 transposase dna-binding domain [Holotrichia oblita]|uniref:Tc5 transposase dna-binding domain n=1 Tax=Holotrichia oblita TaxID=644536 RepID=A0ACB9TNZ1_HOLOL|nr:tc5 transposase dna-binding domain [Holotrichia oblita]